MAAFPQMPNAPMVGQNGRIERAWVEWLDRLRGYLADLDVLETVAGLEVVSAELEAMAGAVRTSLARTEAGIATARADIATLQGRATTLEATTATHTTQIAGLTSADTALSARITDLEVLAAWP